MLTRALLVVLVLFGQLPGRVCTCGAADRHQPAPSTPAGELCECCHHEATDPHQDAGPEDPPPAAEPCPEEDDHHQPGCPAASPRPTPAVALHTPVEVAGSDAAPAVLALPKPAPPPAVTPAIPTRSPPGDPPVPLYLLLLVLRN